MVGFFSPCDEEGALRCYVDVLGGELRAPPWGWARGARGGGVSAGCGIGVVVLPPDGGVPLAVGMGNSGADDAYNRLRGAEVQMHNEEVIILEDGRPMFFFADPDGNGLVYLQETDS